MTLKLAEGIADATTTAAPKSAAAIGAKASARSSCGGWCLPCSLLVAGILLVEILVAAFEIPPFVLASPSAIAAQFAEYLPAVLAATLVTGLERAHRAHHRVGHRGGARRARFIREGHRRHARPRRGRRRRRADRRARAGALHDVRQHVRGRPASSSRRSPCSCRCSSTRCADSGRCARCTATCCGRTRPRVGRRTARSRSLRACRLLHRPAHRRLARGDLGTRRRVLRRPREGLGSAITTAASSSAYARAWAFVIGAILLGLIVYIVTTLLERIVSRHR